MAKMQYPAVPGFLHEDLECTSTLIAELVNQPKLYKWYAVYAHPEAMATT